MAEETNETPEQTPEPDDRAELLAELERIGIDSPQQLQNMQTASSQAGQLANMVGSLRDEIRQLRGEPKPAEPTYNEYGATEDVGTMIERSVERAIERRQKQATEAQRAAQQQAFREIQQIQGDPDFKLVETVWEDHLNSPNTRYSIQSGQSSITNEYHKLVRGYYRKIAQRSKEAIEGMGEKPSVPHVESNQSDVSTPQFTETTEKSEQIRQAQERWTGSDDDIDAILDAALPPGDLSSMR